MTSNETREVGEHVLVRRDMIASACHAIRTGDNAPQTLEYLRQASLAAPAIGGVDAVEALGPIPQFDSFAINPVGEGDICVEGSSRFAHERDVAKLFKWARAAQALIASLAKPEPAGGVDAVARLIWNRWHARHGGDYDGAEGTLARADTESLAKQIIASLSPAATPVSETEPVAVIGFYPREREPHLLSWNALPYGEYELYAKPASSPAVEAVRADIIGLRARTERRRNLGISDGETEGDGEELANVVVPLRMLERVLSALDTEAR